MDWLVMGTRGGKPGRWKLEAADESAARQKAVAGGVAVQEVRRYPVGQVAAAAAVEPASAVLAIEASEPEPADEEAPMDAGHSALPHEESALDHEEPAGLTPAPEETPETPKAKAKSARSVSSTSKRKSIWGIAAIAAGVLGIITGFIAPARLAAIPLCSVGLLLAIAGAWYAVKRKRAGLLLPALGIVVCAAAVGFEVYTAIQRSHQGHEAPPTVAETLERERADRVAHSNIQVQFVGIRPAGKGKYDMTFTYKLLASGSVNQLNGRLRINDANGHEITTLAVFQVFPQGLGTDAVRREDRWTLDDATAGALQADASQLKVEFDPYSVQ